METQNVSAQLYFKQLPEDPKAGSFGCNQTSSDLSTCVNDHDTDTSIENAFQQQLDLSEYYKSPSVFGAMKKDYMDKTMENQNVSAPQEVGDNKPPLLNPTPENIPVGPRDFLNKNGLTGKSNFGSTTTNVLIFDVIGLAIFIYFYLTYLKK